MISPVGKEARRTVRSGVKQLSRGKHRVKHLFFSIDVNVSKFENDPKCGLFGFILMGITGKVISRKSGMK